MKVIINSVIDKFWFLNTMPFGQKVAFRIGDFITPRMSGKIKRDEDINWEDVYVIVAITEDTYYSISMHTLINNKERIYHFREQDLYNSTIEYVEGYFMLDENYIEGKIVDMLN